MCGPLGTAVTEEDATTVAEFVTKLKALFEGEQGYWWDIHDRGRALQQAAQRGRVGVVKSLYGEIRETCLRCHGMSVKSHERSFLNPPTWR